jgi:hypothetical protein
MLCARTQTRIDAARVCESCSAAPQFARVVNDDGAVAALVTTSPVIASHVVVVVVGCSASGV